MKNIKFNILELLILKQRVLIREISDKLDLPELEIWKLLTSIETDIQENGASLSFNIENIEVVLNIINTVQFEQYYYELMRSQNVEWDQKDRVNYILLKLFYQKSFTKIEELSEQLFVSSRQISNDLQITREFLSKYDINIKSVPHYGLELIGEEFKKRLCIADIYSKTTNLDSLYQTEELSRTQRQTMMSIIRKILTDIFLSHNYSISDPIYENLIVHIFITILRLKSNHDVQIHQSINNDNLINNIANNIADKLEEMFNIQLNQSEREYINVHIQSKRSYDSKLADQIPSEVSELVFKMIERIDSNFNTKFRLDFNLCMILSLHFLSLINRIKYGLYQKNPLLEQIKKRYMYEFALAEEGCKVINDKFDCELTEDEIGYVALDLRMSIEKRYMNMKNRILLVCSTGRGSAELLKMKFQEQFSQYIDSLELCSSREILTMDLATYDYIFTTVPIFINTTKPIFKISLFLDKHDISEIHNFFSASKSNRKCLKYFEDVLFMGEVEFLDKKDAITKMIHQIRKYKNVPDNFEESVFLREKEADTSFGNKVAFPHPKDLLTDTTFTCIAISKKPIQWGSSKVQLILLTSIENNKNKNIQDFYQLLSKIINNNSNIEVLIKKPTYDTLCEIILDEKV